MDESRSKLTDYEIDALSSTFNLSDGHARYALPEDHLLVFQMLIHSLRQEIRQESLEERFSQLFFGLANQDVSSLIHNVLYCPSASVSIEIVANYLRMKRMSVALIEPTFDNIADIMRRHDVDLLSMDENTIRSGDLSRYLGDVKPSAVFLVFPNNPTGFMPDEATFRQIVEDCAKREIFIIVDFSFRFFSTQLRSWDQYRVLGESGSSYITIEDTGKTWNTLETKVSPLLSDRESHPLLSDIYRDIFMSISPLSLIVLNGIIKSSIDAGFDETIISRSEINRGALISAISGTYLRPVGLSNSSVEWVSIDDDKYDLQVIEHLMSFGIHTLPGRYFFWSHPKKGEKYLRVALMRDTNMFARAMDVLKKSLLSGAAVYRTSGYRNQPHC